MSSKRNYYMVVNKKSRMRQVMEEAAPNGQKKQALTVNKNRAWDDGETLAKGTVCLLKISDEKNTVEVKEVSVVITALHYYKQSGNIRYKVACRDGHITGTHGRGVRPKEHITAKLMGINVSELDKLHHRLTAVIYL